MGDPLERTQAGEEPSPVICRTYPEDIQFLAHIELRPKTVN
jgi:hypothetical protein